MTPVPVQPAYVVKVEPSFYRTWTVYPVIGDPPSTGATQVTIMFSSKDVVDGAAGTIGSVGSTAP